MAANSQEIASRLLERLVRALRSTAREVTPWFAEQMPDSYFRDTDEPTVVAHLSAVVAARISGASPRMLLRDEERETWTFIQQRSYRGLLSGLIAQLPSDRTLASAKVHTAGDDSLILDVFRFGTEPRFDPEDPHLRSKLEETLAYARGLGDEAAPFELPVHLARSSADFVKAASPLRIHETWRLVREVEGTDAVISSVSLQRESGLTRISVAAGNADTRTLFERIVNHLGRRGYDITRAFLDVFPTDGRPLPERAAETIGQSSDARRAARSEGPEWLTGGTREHRMASPRRTPRGPGTVSSLGFVIHDPKGELLDESGAAWKTMSRELGRLAWLDDQVMTRLDRHPDERIEEAEALVGLTRLVHPRLAKLNPHAFTRDRLFAHLDQQAILAREIARLFLDRFDPRDPLDADAFEKRRAILAATTERSVEAEPGRRFFDMLLEAVARITRTNAFLEGRAALAFRVDPRLFDDEAEEEVPFGVFFVHGRSLDGFYVRFAEIARGGVRVVQPESEEQYVVESERVYEEAHALALAQQLKNKDIPEGGAKAVVLVGPDASIDRSVRAFIESLLDLLVDDEATRARVIERGDEESEHLHLGPDENISSELIAWAVSRAEQRGYPHARALMSSKPEAGISHEVYGVTSEGVAVFLEEALRARGIDPRRSPFTLKMTGGPEGDVAGNLLRVLDREFGGNARVVGIADGSGSAWDPAGLDRQELLRLVGSSEPIARFDPERLGPGGRKVSLEEEDGLRIRNGLCFDVEADAFVPAGGRTETIHAGNWQRFLRSDGRPSSRVIVEGTSHFITREARAHLSSAGVLIVRDSSATKCGVISSSLEIAASMILSREELLAHKPRFVDEVLARLRELAAEEARRLFADHRRDPRISLPERSERLSRAILAVSDAVAGALARMPEADKRAFDDVVLGYLPPVVVELARDWVFSRLPTVYRDRLIAARIGARLVYREGLVFLDQFPSEEALARAALDYHRCEREVGALAERVRASGIADASRIADLLDAGGARAALLTGSAAIRADG